MRLEVHRAQFPDLAAIVDPGDKPARLFILAHLEPVFDQDDSGFDHRPLPLRAHLEKTRDLLRRAEPHDALHTGPVVPTAMENPRLACRRHMLYVTLDVHLRFFSFGRRRQCHNSKYPGTDSFRNTLNHPALPCCVAALEDDYNFESLML